MTKHNSPSIGLGTAAIGRPQYINIRTNETTFASMDAFRSSGFDMLDEAYRQGVRYFDTAPGYGLAEQLVIAWLAAQEHTDVEVATKWGYTYVANFDLTATIHEVKEHSLQKLEEQWKQSQKLLPFLSTYQIHSASFESGVLDNERVLMRLAELRAMHGLKIGITSTGANQVEVIKKALEIEVNHHRLFEVFQVTYNIWDQSLVQLSADLKARRCRIIIKEALANGRIFTNPRFPHYREAYNCLETLARKYAVGVDAIALKFCLQTIDVYQVLSGAAETKHLSENLKAMDFMIDDEDLDKLCKLAIHPQQYWGERRKLAWN